MNFLLFLLGVGLEILGFFRHLCFQWPGDYLIAAAGLAIGIIAIKRSKRIARWDRTLRGNH